MWCVRCQLNSKEMLGKFGISEPAKNNRLQILQSALSFKQKKKKKKNQLYLSPNLCFANWICCCNYIMQLKNTLVNMGMNGKIN